MLSVLNTDSMLINRRELIFKIIYILDIYFKDKRAYDFTLFFWPKKKDIDLIKLDIQFNWRITESNEFIVSSSVFSLFEPKNFKSPFLMLQNNKDVSALIAQNFPSFEIKIDEFSANFSLINGVTFHRDTWKRTMSQLLGSDNVTQYYAQTRFDNLNSLLIQKEHKDKLIKI